MKKVYLTGDMTLDNVGRVLSKAYAWDVTMAGFNQWLIDLLNPSSPLLSASPDFFVVILSPRFLTDNPDASTQLDQFLNASKMIENKMQVLFTNFIPDPVTPQGIIEGNKLQQFAAELNQKLYRFEKEHSWFHVIDQAGLIGLHGIRQIHDSRFEVIGRMYVSPKGEKIYADFLNRNLSALTRSPKKVLALDLDNTLWGGVLGEDGPEGIRLGGDNSGYAYLRFQKALKRLKENGILLTICSKNNEQDALNVLNTHTDMILKPDDFVSYRINWISKSENIKSMAKELNLGVDSFVFFDDTKFEREQMKQLLPQVDVIDVPTDAAEYVCVLSEYQGFDTLRITDEDKNRSDMYLKDSERKKLQSESASIEEFYKSLEMRAQILPVNEGSLSRVHQLIHKTNQFNLTTRRYNEQELKNLTADPLKSAVFSLALKDRLGESGMTGVIIIKKHSDHWDLDSFLLSCRIIGRTVEFALIRWLAIRAMQSGVKSLHAEFIPTTKNQIATDFLSQAGFIYDESVKKWKLDLAMTSKIPNDYVSIQ